MNSINFKNYIDHSIILGFVFLAFGYYLSGSIAVVSNIESRIVNIAYRGLIVFLFIVPFLALILKKVTFKNAEVLLLVFWFLYLSRVLYDINIVGTTYNNTYNKGITVSFIYLILFFNILVPFFVIITNKVDHLAEKIFNYSYALLVISTIVLSYSILSSSAYLNRINAARFSLGSDGASVINPIRISYLGTLGLATWLFKYLYFKVNKAELVFLLALSGLSVFLLVIGASRGPLILAVLTLFLIVINYLKQQTSWINKAKVYAGVAIFILASGFYIKQQSEKILILERLAKTADRLGKGKEEERNVVYNIAWEQFLESPLIGTSFLTRHSDNNYDRVFPHNLILESLMALGIIGTIFLAGVLYRYIINILQIKLYNKFKQYFLLITMPFFLHGLLSGSILLDIEFWILLTLSISLNKDV